jgi:hypothetical protein
LTEKKKRVATLFNSTVDGGRVSFSHFLMHPKYSICEELNDLSHDLELLKVKIKTHRLFEGHDLDELMQVL